MEEGQKPEAPADAEESVDTPRKALNVGLRAGAIAAVLYYPAVIAVGLLSYVAATPPPRGPLPSEIWARDTAFLILSYPSHLVSGSEGSSVWSVVNPLAHGAIVGAAGALLSGRFRWVTRKGLR
jgi:hypothetical protein